MKIFKLILLFFFCIHFSECNLKKNERQIEIQKIEIHNELCENCIGLRSINIKYFFNTDRLLKSTISLSTKKSFSFSVRRYEFSTVNKSHFKYEYIYDKFDMSKYGSLNQIKEDFKDIIYFKKMKVKNTDLELVCNSKTVISCYLNGTKISELDSVKMNKDFDDKFVRKLP